MDIKEAYNKLQENKDILEKYQSENLSETDTRCKIIDFIFKEVLQFSEDTITREPSYNIEGKVNYIDYIFATNVNRFLVEAKRTDVKFNLPIGTKRVKGSTSLSIDVNTKKALDQAKKYCEDQKINVGCISNGTTFIVFIRNNFISKFDTYIFNGIDGILKDFTNFYNVFNPYYNGEETLKEILNSKNQDIREHPQFSKSINEVVFDRDLKINRNPFDVHMKPIIDHFFSDLVSETTIKYLNDCYCTQESIDKYNRQILSFFSDNLPSLDLPVQDVSFFQSAFTNSIRNLNDDKFISKKQVMILVGGVGVGKTTFLHRFFEFILPLSIKKNTLWINIDFLKESREYVDIKDIIYIEALNQIRVRYPELRVDEYDMLEQIYYTDITRMKNGALRGLVLTNPEIVQIKIAEFLLDRQKDESRFAEDVLKYFSQDPIHFKNIFITIDNADQKTEDFQIRCVTAAYDIGKKINSIIILSMREDSYWRLKNVNPLDAYSGSAFHVSAPTVSNVLKKRLSAASKYFSNDFIYVETDNNLKVKIKKCDLLTILSNSLFDCSEEKIEFFNYISANNIRFSLEMLSTFLTSGHTNTTEYVKTYLNTGDYNIPFHAFIRSIALGDFKYYHSDKSLFINVLEENNDGFYSHFTKLRLLKYLSEKLSISTPAGKGFIIIEDIYKLFENICNNKENFYVILNMLLSKRLIESEGGYRNTISDAKYIKLSSAGYYYLTNLINKFAYLERLCEDTMIHSQKYFKEIEKLSNEILDENTNKNKIEIRLNRIELFLNYLREEENKELDYIHNTDINFVFMDEITQNFNIERKKILKIK